MAVGLTAPAPERLHPVPGVRLGIARAGIRKANRRDLLVVAFDPDTVAAGVFTRNRFCAAPVLVCREHLQAGSGIRALVVNTGNANAGTGPRVSRTRARPALPLHVCSASNRSRCCRSPPG